MATNKSTEGVESAASADMDVVMSEVKMSIASTLLFGALILLSKYPFTVYGTQSGTPNAMSASSEFQSLFGQQSLYAVGALLVFVAGFIGLAGYYLSRARSDPYGGTRRTHAARAFAALYFLTVLHFGFNQVAYGALVNAAIIHHLGTILSSLV